MMGQDNITWTGARAPGVERCRSLAWRCSTEQVDSDTERRPHAAAESTKGGGKPDLPTGMLGASLTEADQGRPYLIGQLWSRTEGKPAVRNLRGDDGNGGIIRSPQRAIVLPDLPVLRQPNELPQSMAVLPGRPPNLEEVAGTEVAGTAPQLGNVRADPAPPSAAASADRTRLGQNGESYLRNPLR